MARKTFNRDIIPRGPLVDKESGLKMGVRIEDERGRLIPSIKRKIANSPNDILYYQEIHSQQNLINQPACQKGYHLNAEGACVEKSGGTGGMVGAHGYGGESTCDEYQQECSAANGYASSTTTPPFCSCSSEMAPTYDVMGVDLSIGECSYASFGSAGGMNWENFTNCVYNYLSTGYAQSYLNQYSMTPMNQNCIFNYQSCLLSVYGGGGFGGGKGFDNDDSGMESPDKFYSGGRMWQQRRANKRRTNPMSRPPRRIPKPNPGGGGSSRNLRPSCCDGGMGAYGTFYCHGNGSISDECTNCGQVPPVAYQQCSPSGGFTNDYQGSHSCVQVDDWHTQCCECNSHAGSGTSGAQQCYNNYGEGQGDGYWVCGGFAADLGCGFCNWVLHAPPPPPHQCPPGYQVFWNNNWQMWDCEEGMEGPDSDKGSPASRKGGRIATRSVKGNNIR